ncbi:MAG: alpha,alpha-trehalase TreF [Bacteroidota bacterium]|jgi:alpha,alpha-trehalase
MRDHTEMVELFKAVQTQNIFTDSKTFCDCLPKNNLSTIQEKYNVEKAMAGFDLKAFVLTHFELPEKFAATVIADMKGTVEMHIEKLWSVLLRQPDGKSEGTLLPLPYPYIVPGGRFGEIYYWDSYFTMLGLKAAGKIDLIESMAKNFAHLIKTVGYIPNGNRTYYIGRSQPPFFALIIQLLADLKGEAILGEYLDVLEIEYQYWMSGDRLVHLPTGELNRYWDEHNTPRPEAYKEDLELAERAAKEDGSVFRNIRAAAASGWDFSTRWFKDENKFESIHTIDIVPVDLNALLYLFESILEKAYIVVGAKEKASTMLQAKEKRKALVLQYCWNASAKTFCDYDVKAGTTKNTISLAMLFPLYAQMATAEQAKTVVENLSAHLLFDGGVATTQNNSGQQWDSPNGWAPLQWITYVALQNYGYDALAETLRNRWVQLNRQVFARTGKMMEKYNVVNTQLEAGGGEYEGQDGFGWTNGVFLAMVAKEK